jgi:hypothetical protein
MLLRNVDKLYVAWTRYDPKKTVCSTDFFFNKLFGYFGRNCLGMVAVIFWIFNEDN